MKKNYLTQNQVLQQKSQAITGKNLLLKAIVFLLAISNTTFAREKESDKGPWDGKNLREEIVFKRSRTAKHFLIENGSKISSFISPSSIHYLEAGKWENISTTILMNTNSKYPTHQFAAEKNAVKTYFPSNPFSHYLVMETNDGIFKEKITAIKFLDANNAVVGALPVSGNVLATVKGNRISYSGFFPNVSLEYSLGNDQRKFNFIIHSAAFLSSIPALATSIVIEEEFISAAAEMEIKMHKSELSVMVQDKQVLSFSAPLAFDSNTEVENLSSGKITIENNQNSYSLNTSFSVAWLKNNSRVFPLLLDPTVNYYPQNVSMWTGQQGSNAAKTSGYLRLTGATTASWAKFDLATLPAGAAVTAATFYGYHYTTTGSKIAEIRGLQAVDPVTAAAGPLFTQSYGGPLYDGAYNFGTATFGWNPGILNNTALTDIANAAGNWIGLGFGYLSGSATFMYVYGYNAASAADIPYLEVTYFTTPCVGAPFANAVTPSSFTTCPSYTNPAVGIANTYTVGGLTYQWYSSTISPVGLYSPIPGATLNIAPTPTLGVTTWFQVVATCTNPGGLSTTLTPAQFTVAGTTIDNVPYFEGFEGLQGDHRLPNCSWSTTNLGSTIGTYTSSRSDNRVPYDGNNFASFGLPSNNHHVYTNGINMIAGITYSASIMYATEYQGGNNWTELSLLYGTTQSINGLVPIATVSPAISGSYKQLSGLFTVPSTGIYYIAIKATGVTGTALYLSCDNLEVTIPCAGAGAVNSPTLVVTASDQTLCANTDINISAAGADTYTWSTGANTSGITETPYIVGNINYTVQGSNALTGCTAEFVVPVNVIASPIVLATAYPATVCVGKPLVLSAYGDAVSYLWSNGTPGSAITVTTSAANNYSVIGTGANGCISQSGVAVAVHSVVNVGVTSNATSDACVNDVITLNATGAVTYDWHYDTSPVVLQGSQINVSLSAPTVFTVSGIGSNGCEAKTTLAQNVNACVGVKEHSGSIEGLFIYPNPTNDNFTVELNTTETKTIDVTDLSGRVILTTVNMDMKTRINLETLASGVYFVKVKTSNAVETIKIVKH